MAKVLLLASFVLVLSNCVCLNAQQLGITGGYYANIQDFPYQVSIRDAVLKIHICGGFIYRSYVVITAANCVAGREPAMHVYFGSHDLYNNGAVADVTRIVAHPNFDNQNRNNDIAVLFLSRSISFPPLSLPIGIAGFNEVCPGNQRGVVSGWGCDRSDSCIVQSLMFMYVRLMTGDECQQTLEVRPNMICATGGNAGTCYGDNGDPLVITNANGTRKLVGIVSFARTNGCASNEPTAYTLVPAFAGWIQSVVGFAESS